MLIEIKFHKESIDPSSKNDVKYEATLLKITSFGKKKAISY